VLELSASASCLGIEHLKRVVVLNGEAKQISPHNNSKIVEGRRHE
jgi:hypothetical protein